ncbi:MAG: hypothetical protein JWR15_3779 [Prosthecobacter sp.]|nr:hypothetical protein [Prosthecobacter sp.]
MPSEIREPMLEAIPGAFGGFGRVGLEDHAVARGIGPCLLVPSVIEDQALAFFTKEHLIGDLKAELFTGLWHKAVGI